MTPIYYEPDGAPGFELLTKIKYEPDPPFPLAVRFVCDPDFRQNNFSEWLNFIHVVAGMDWYFRCRRTGDADFGFSFNLFNQVNIDRLRDTGRTTTIIEHDATGGTVSKMIPMDEFVRRLEHGDVIYETHEARYKRLQNEFNPHLKKKAKAAFVAFTEILSNPTILEYMILIYDSRMVRMNMRLGVFIMCMEKWKKWQSGKVDSKTQILERCLIELEQSGERLFGMKVLKLETIRDCITFVQHSLKEFSQRCTGWFVKQIYSNYVESDRFKRYLHRILKKKGRSDIGQILTCGYDQHADIVVRLIFSRFFYLPDWQERIRVIDAQVLQGKTVMLDIFDFIALAIQGNNEKHYVGSLIHGFDFAMKKKNERNRRKGLGEKAQKQVFTSITTQVNEYLSQIACYLIANDGIGIGRGNAFRDYYYHLFTHRRQIPKLEIIYKAAGGAPRLTWVNYDIKHYPYVKIPLKLDEAWITQKTHNKIIAFLNQMDDFFLASILDADALLHNHEIKPSGFDYESDPGLSSLVDLFIVKIDKLIAGNFALVKEAEKKTKKKKDTEEKKLEKMLHFFEEEEVIREKISERSIPIFANQPMEDQDKREKNQPHVRETKNQTDQEEKIHNQHIVNSEASSTEKKLSPSKGEVKRLRREEAAERAKQKGLPVPKGVLDRAKRREKEAKRIARKAERQKEKEGSKS